MKDEKAPIPGHPPVVWDLPEHRVQTSTEALARQRKWDLRFLSMAMRVAAWSHDPSTKCGSVIVRPDMSIVSVGFNGFPRGCSDHPDIYANRPLKYERVVHGEVNAILAAKGDTRFNTIYCWPPGFGPSCARCTGVIIQAGISRVVAIRASAEHNTRWAESCQIALDMYNEAGVEVVLYDNSAIDELDA